MSYRERIEFAALSVSDSLRGELPPIDVLQQLYSSRLKNVDSASYRVYTALFYSDELRSGNKAYEGEFGSSYSHQDIFSALFIDSIDFLGRDFIKNSSNNGLKPEDTESLTRLVEAKHRLQNQIMTFSNIYANNSPVLAYQGLSSIMYEARCVLFNDMDLPARAEAINKKLMAGILAEHKVLQALRKSGWKNAYYASVNDDTKFSTDLVVPVGAWQNRRWLDLQVKAGPKMRIRKNAYGIVDVTVPVRPEIDAFNMTLQEQEWLSAFVAHEASQVNFLEVAPSSN